MNRPFPKPELRTMRERLAALRNVVPFARLVWPTSRGLTLASMGLRLVRALLPVLTLYVGKLIIDQVVHLVQTGTVPHAPGDALRSGQLDRLLLFLLAELGLAVFSDVLGRGASLLDSVLGELLTNSTSVRLMEHAATLDLAGFEDSDLQDKLESARRQGGNPLRVLRPLKRRRFFGLQRRVLSKAKSTIGQSESEFAREFQCSEPGIIGDAYLELCRVLQLQAFPAGELLKRP